MKNIYWLVVLSSFRINAVYGSDVKNYDIDIEEYHFAHPGKISEIDKQIKSIPITSESSFRKSICFRKKTTGINYNRGEGLPYEEYEIIGAIPVVPKDKK